MSNILDISNVNKTFGGLRALSEINLKVEEGTIHAIIGPNGAGKSTLLNILGGLDQPTAGRVQVGETDLFSLKEVDRSRWRNRHLGFVFQFHHLMPEFSAVEAVAMPARIGGLAKSQALESAQFLLSELGLADRVNHRPGQLSGGERQRVAIARALINRPACVLMDEPTGNLDPATAEQVLHLMHDLSFEETAFVIVTHDPKIAGQMDKQYLLEAGKLCLE